MQQQLAVRMAVGFGQMMGRFGWSDGFEPGSVLGEVFEGEKLSKLFVDRVFEPGHLSAWGVWNWVGE